MKLCGGPSKVHSIELQKEKHMTSRSRLAIGFCVGLLTLGASLSSAHAQPAAPPPRAPPPPYGRPPGYGYPPPPPPPPRGMYREGLVLGFALGGGVIATKDCPNVCGGAGMGEFHIGAMMNPRLALMGDFF